MSSPSAMELATLLADGYVPIWRTGLLHWSRGRREGAWCAGIAIFLVFSGLVPLTFVMMTLLSVLAVATCLRAYALHEYARQLTELAMQEQQSAAASEDEAEGSASGSTAAAAGAGASTPARRRPRRPSLFTAVAAARPLSLLNLRLSLIDRDFTEQDFDLLVRLDELEAATRQDPTPPPLPESQLAQLPVHVHRSPAKKGKGKQQAQQAAAAAALLEVAACQKKLGPAAGVASGGAAQQAQQAQQVQPTQRKVPVLVEPQPAAPTTPAQRPQRSGSSARLQALPQGRAAPFATTAAAAAAGEAEGGEIKAAYPPAAATAAAAAGRQQPEIVPADAAPALAAGEGAAPQQGCCALESEGEDEVPLCSICLDPFVDGAQILSLPCHHQYHADCVTQWLRLKGMHSTCPNCKGTVFSNNSPENAATPASVAAA